MAKRPGTLIKELRTELRYFQMMYRIEIRWLRKSRDRIEKIAAKMRSIQKESRK